MSTHGSRIGRIGRYVAVRSRSTRHQGCDGVDDDEVERSMKQIGRASEPPPPRPRSALPAPPAQGAAAGETEADPDDGDDGDAFTGDHPAEVGADGHPPAEHLQLTVPIRRRSA
ncbi:hypothetical protein AB0D27_23585 [Streptomyces sp. NPDC048415]|uniref:hypothetical protein n=1 Tax=Streptomyces sp. NPDC048415 TaxID=3154822 RepID=UPI00342FF74B